MAENKLADISTEFAIQILKLTDSIKGHYSLSNQLERSEAIEPTGSEKSLALRQKKTVFTVFFLYKGFEQGGSRNNDWIGRIGAVAIM